MIDQVECKGWMDKIEELGMVGFFSSYVCKLQEKANFFIWKWGNKKSPGVLWNRGTKPYRAIMGNIPIPDKSLKSKSFGIELDIGKFFIYFHANVLAEICFHRKFQKNGIQKAL